MPESLIEHITDWRNAVVVERASRTIRNVALSGTASQNGYRYAASALREARPLYENTPVFLDHPASVQRPRDRSARDLAGSVVNVRYESDRLRGDIRTLDTEAGRTLLALAEADGPGVGMSHVVLAERSGDGQVVERIVEVISVDAVAFPATTRTFRESRVATPSSERRSRVRRVRRLMKHVSEGRVGIPHPTEPGGSAERTAPASDAAVPVPGSGSSWPVSLERLLASVDAQLPGHLRRLAAASGIPSRGRGVRVGVFPSHVVVEWRSVGRRPEHFALAWRLDGDAVVLGERLVPADTILPSLARWIDLFRPPSPETRPDTVPASERHALHHSIAERGPTSVLRRPSERGPIADDQFIRAIRRR